MLAGGNGNNWRLVGEQRWSWFSWSHRGLKLRNSWPKCCKPVSAQGTFMPRRISFIIIINIIYLKGWITAGERKRERFYLLIHLPNDCNGHSRADLKPETRVSWVSTGVQAFGSSRPLGGSWIWSGAIWDGSIAGSSSTSHLNQI